MLDTKIEKCIKEVLRFEGIEKNLVEEEGKIQADELALREAKISGGLISDSKLSEAAARSRAVERDIQASRGLITKAKTKLQEAIGEERQNYDAEKESLCLAVDNFRKACLRELTDVLAEAQILLNLTMGNRDGDGLMSPYYFIFRKNNTDSPEPDLHTLLVEKVRESSKKRFEKSPLGKLSTIEGEINSRRELSPDAEAEKLLSEARERSINKT